MIGTRMNRASLLTLIPALVLLWLLIPDASSLAFAQAPTRERALVYGIHAFNGLGYASSFAPPTADTIYLLAGVDSALSPRETEIYWWPLTARYEPDWNALNQPVVGTLEVWRAFQRLDAIEPTTYVVQFPDGPGGAGALYVGEQAHAAYADFEERRREHRDALWEYYQREAAYRRELDAAVGRAGQGETSEPGEPPREPAPFRTFSTGLNQGHVLNLPVGRYRVRVVGQDGRLVPGSERNLVVFAPRRAGLGYAVYPQERWTNPIGADDPNAVIYTAGGGALYVQPFHSLEVNDRFFNRLEDPQSRAVDEDAWRWVRIRPYEGARLDVSDGRASRDPLEQKRYQVQQVPGGGLGYRIVEQPPEAAGRTPDLDAVRVDVEPDREYRIRLLHLDGATVPGSTREVRPIASPGAWALAAVPAIPLVLAASLWIRRRAR